MESLLGREDEEDLIISARLVQFVTPAVVFNQPPRAASPLIA